MQLSAAHLTGTSGKDNLLITYYGTLLDKHPVLNGPCCSLVASVSSQRSIEHGCCMLLLLEDVEVADLRLPRTILTLFMTISGAAV